MPKKKKRKKTTAATKRRVKKNPALTKLEAVKEFLSREKEYIKRDETLTSDAGFKKFFEGKTSVIEGIEKILRSSK